jgi:predicted esterase
VQKHTFKAEKTVRYFSLGELNQQTKHVWIVLHGYGQLPQFFLKKFETLVNEDSVVLAPEGLSRFYLEGFKGRVGASWMTSDDREQEIEDYVNYLCTFFNTQVKPFVNTNCQIHVIGFSQGAATACRWVNSGLVKVNELVLWAGSFPHDLNFDLAKQIFNQLKLTLVVGNKDEFEPIIKLQDHQNKLNELGIKFNVVEFEGGHDIDKKTLEKYFKV